MNQDKITEAIDNPFDKVETYVKTPGLIDSSQLSRFLKFQLCFLIDLKQGLSARETVSSDGDNAALVKFMRTRQGTG